MPHIRNVDRKAWRPGTWITEGGDVVHVESVPGAAPHEYADRLAYTLQNTMLTIARAMAAADATRRAGKDKR
ncbi:hypothetical protein D3C87_687250 [compost metagenome]